MEDEWIRITDAAKELGVSASKLSRMARDGKLSSRKDAYDERVTLLSRKELNERFPPRPQSSKKK